MTSSRTATSIYIAARFGVSMDMLPEGLVMSTVWALDFPIGRPKPAPATGVSVAEEL
jgi:hypothetical protein